MNNISTVRMTLYDYDVAPDGVGTYTKIDAGFPSLSHALLYRDRYLGGLYWGTIRNIYGQVIYNVNEGYYSGQ